MGLTNYFLIVADYLEYGFQDAFSIFNKWGNQDKRYEAIVSGKTRRLEDRVPLLKNLRSNRFTEKYSKNKQKN